MKNSIEMTSSTGLGSGRPVGIIDLQKAAFKVDRKGVVLDANDAARPVLAALGCERTGILPPPFIKKYPGIFNSGHGDIRLPVAGSTMRFTVVPFPEAGYTGFYSY